VTYVAVSRAPLEEIDAFRQRMGWGFKWVSSSGSEFNYDYQVSFTAEEQERGQVDYNYAARPLTSEDLSGLSVFYRDDAGDVFHTYSCFARGDELTLTTYVMLDLTPKGRNETGPHYSLTDWVRHHDRYGAGGSVDPTDRYKPR
jgi:predicted dithiol-disulfide oxidoreductase (DUF899 family)